MSSSDKVVLEGGPDELAGQVVQIEVAGADVKIRLGNGYEHFRSTDRHADTPDGSLPVYEWWERTEMPA
jgi:hypothetical protein